LFFYNCKCKQKAVGFAFSLLQISANFDFENQLLRKKQTASAKIGGISEVKMNKLFCTPLNLHYLCIIFAIGFSAKLGNLFLFYTKPHVLFYNLAFY